MLFRSWSRTAFLNLGTTEIWGWILLCCRGCPVHCRMLGSVPDRYPKETSGGCPVVTKKKKNGPRHCQISPGGQNHPSWEPPDERDLASTWASPLLDTVLEQPRQGTSQPWKGRPRTLPSTPTWTASLPVGWRSWLVVLSSHYRTR